MGRAQGFDGVRYVSPVTARLFSKAGHSEALGLSAGEVLAPIEANWRDSRQRSGQAPSLQQQAASGGGEEDEDDEDDEEEEEEDEEEEAAPPPLMAGGLAMHQRQVEVVRPSAASPVPSVEGMTSPQAHLELILFERVSEAVCSRARLSLGCMRLLLLVSWWACDIGLPWVLASHQQCGGGSGRRCPGLRKRERTTRSGQPKKYVLCFEFRLAPICVIIRSPADAMPGLGGAHGSLVLQ